MLGAACSPTKPRKSVAAERPKPKKKVTFEYLIELLKHPEEVEREPGRWMPWSYPHPPNSA